jgi:FtsP/CotA-like multicopper oxidase with cupredoxin domain
MSSWSRERLSIGNALVMLVLVLGTAAISRTMMGCGSSGGSSTETTSGSAFPQPQVLRSSNGVLSLTLRAKLATIKIFGPAAAPTTGAGATSEGSKMVEVATITGPTYDGKIPAPTLILDPGDTLKIKLINDLPPNPPVTRTGMYPHEPYTTNFHSHGLEVSPEGNSDNVLRMMEPGTTNQVEIKIPTYHHAGTFWFHPHHHGAVTYQMMGGMAGMLIVRGDGGTVDQVPEVKAAKDIVMDFQVLHSTSDNQVAFVNPTATQLGSSTPQAADGVWSAYLPPSNTYFTTNGVLNPTLHMRPGEVQRWRMLNAGSGETLLLALQGHRLNVLENDGINVQNLVTLAPGVPYVMGAGQRVDMMVQASQTPGTYLLQCLNPTTNASVSPQGIAPAPRSSHISGDFPTPSYPITLATIVISGEPKNMSLPTENLPPPEGLPSITTMTTTTPNAVRNISFELCGEMAGMTPLNARLPSCGWYAAKYDSNYWGGIPFASLNMIRDADDTGVPSNPPNPAMPLIDFMKEGLFDDNVPLFDDMVVNNYEQWTVVNKSFSDHVFHIHQNPFLVTQINGIALPFPEWHDSIVVPAATGGMPITSPNVTFGSITFVTHFDPITVGQFVMHCHVLQHEDIGMMQLMEILPASTAAARRQKIAAEKLSHKLGFLLTVGTSTRSEKSAAINTSGRNDESGLCVSGRLRPPSGKD